MSNAVNPLMIESFRWHGPTDRVTLRDIRQTGAEGVYTALHHIPYGEAWSRENLLVVPNGPRSLRHRRTATAHGSSA